MLATLLHDRDFLLVPDNCEHLLDEVAALATAVLHTCPRVRILATSREALGIAGEWTFEMPPLADWAELFLERAGSAAAEATTEEIESLCAALDHMPLAIELAAGQSATLSVRQIIDMLDDRSEILRGGTSDQQAGTPRCRPPSRLLPVADRERTALVLRSRGLQRRFRPRRCQGSDRAPRSPTGSDRADQQIDAHIAERRPSAMWRGPDPVRQSHVNWVVALAADAYLGLRGPRCLQWTRRLDAEMANVRAATNCVDPHSVTYLEIVGNVYWFWFRRGFAGEGMRMLEPAVAAPTSIPTATRARALAGRAIMCYLGADLPTLFAVPTGLGEVCTEFDVRSTSRVEQVARGDAEEALEVGRRYNSPWTVAEALMSLGAADFRAGNHQSAGEHLEAAVPTARDCGYDWLAASTLWIHAKSDIAQNKWNGPAEQKLAQMVEYCERTYDLASWMVALFTLAYTLFRRERHDMAGRLIGVVDNMTELTGYSPEKMDVVELASFGAAMRSEIDPEILSLESSADRSMTRDETRGLVQEWAGSTDILIGF